MSRFLQIFNFLGVMMLAVLCSFQWRTNRSLNLDIVEREKIRLQQMATIQEQDKATKGYAADLEDFRRQLILSENALKESQAKFRAMAAERDDLVVERDQLRSSLDKYVAAVAERDAALKKAGEQIQSISADRNQAIGKFNDLAEKYNDLATRQSKASQNKQ